jgi:hypothetical protein
MFLFSKLIFFLNLLFVAIYATNSTVVGGSNSSQTIQFGSVADLVSLSGTFGAGSIFGADGNDTLVFLAGAAVNAATVVKLDAGNDSLVFNNNILFGGFGGGAGNDVFSGSVTIGTSGVSFWGGSGNDTFNFSTITGTGGTAYFWNDATGTDSLVFNSVISGGAGGGSAAAIFGISVGLGSATALDISFASGQTTNLFGSDGASSAFFLGGSTASTLVSFGFGNTSTTIIFSGGALATLQGGAFETGYGTNIFTNASATTGTANFGIATAIPTFS